MGARHGPPLVVGYGDGEMYPRLRRPGGRARSPTASAYLEDGDYVAIDRTGRAHLRRLRARRSMRPIRDRRRLRRADGEGQLPALHGKGDPRPAGRRASTRWPAYLDPVGDGATPPRRASTSPASSRLQIVACGTASYAGMIGTLRVRAAGRPAGRRRDRLGVPLPRAGADAGHPGDGHLPVGRDRRHPGRAALVQGRTGWRPPPSSTCTPRPWPARPTCCCRPTPGRRSACSRPRPSPPRSRC